MEKELEEEMLARMPKSWLLLRSIYLRQLEKEKREQSEKKE